MFEIRIDKRYPQLVRLYVLKEGDTIGDEIAMFHVKHLPKLAKTIKTVLDRGTYVNNEFSLELPITPETLDLYREKTLCPLCGAAEPQVEVKSFDGWQDELDPWSRCLICSERLDLMDFPEHNGMWFVYATHHRNGQPIPEGYLIHYDSGLQ